MKHSFTALCWAVIALGLAMACTKKPTPKTPGPAPEKDYGSETAIADAGRGRDLSEMGFTYEYTTIYFDLNQATIRPNQVEPLGAVAVAIRSRKACVITGHACPLGSAIYNQALGYHRAQAVLTHFRTLGVRTGFQVSSMGEEQPATEDPAQYALNRRVVVTCR